MANILPTEKKIAAVSMLCEGNSIRAIERMTGVHRDTVMRLGVRVGQGCASAPPRLGPARQFLHRPMNETTFSAIWDSTLGQTLAMPEDQASFSIGLSQGTSDRYERAARITDDEMWTLIESGQL